MKDEWIGYAVDADRALICADFFGMAGNVPKCLGLKVFQSYHCWS